MNLQTYKPTLITQLENHHAFDERENAFREDILRFLHEASAPFSRATLAGHITASAILVDEDFEALALIWHEKLGRWLQPGGHCEAEDLTLPDAALRELVEETHIPASDIILLSSTPLDVDVHQIPERGAEPTHYHYDVRYLFQTQHDLLPKTKSYQWVRLADAAAMDDASIARYAKKVSQTPKN